MDLAISGLGDQWTWRSVDLAINGLGDQWTWRSMDLAINGLGDQWTWRSMDLAINGLGDQWTWARKRWKLVNPRNRKGQPCRGSAFSSMRRPGARSTCSAMTR